ncbi:MAG TPA: CoA-binding protein [Nitrososphaera sp.]|jgi:predicted CoA-binding protein|nr:CoA-binding protein [Nitrososphaera sp.]
MQRDSHSDSDIRKFYGLKNIAVVGMSNTEGKPANYVPKYLIEQGYNVIPVNPNSTEVMGRKSYQSPSQVQPQVDILDIFRPSQDVPAVVKDALGKQGIKVIWMQEGIYSEEAERMARERGIEVVYNRCMMAEHMRLFGEQD